MKELKFKEATLPLESFFVPNKSIFSLIASIVLGITKGELDVYSSKSEDDFFQTEHFRFVETKQSDGIQLDLYMYCNYYVL